MIGIKYQGINIGNKGSGLRSAPFVCVRVFKSLKYMI